MLPLTKEINVVVLLYIDKILISYHVRSLENIPCHHKAKVPIPSSSLQYTRPLTLVPTYVSSSHFHTSIIPQSSSSSPITSSLKELFQRHFCSYFNFTNLLFHSTTIKYPILTRSKTRHLKLKKLFALRHTTISNTDPSSFTHVVKCEN